MSHSDETGKFVPVKDIMLDNNTYRALTKSKYARGFADGSENTISSLINEMLSEYLHT